MVRESFFKIFLGEVILSQNAAVAQSVERRIGSAEVTGPIPVSSLIQSRGNVDIYSVSVIFYYKNMDYT